MSSPARRSPLPPPWQQALLRFFRQAWVEIVVGVLVVVSVSLTLIEFSLNAAPGDSRWQATLVQIEWVNQVITGIFAVELSLRFLASPSKRLFFREYWLDILAVLPLFRMFRAARVVRLLRLARLLRLFGVASRLSSHFPHIMKRGLMEYLFVCGMLALTVLFGTAAMMYFEGSVGEPDGAPFAGPVAGGAGSPVAGGAGMGNSSASGTAPGTASASSVAANSGAANSGAAGSVPGGAEDTAFTLEGSFWFSVYSLLAGEPIPGPPRTLGGRLVAVFVMFMGLTIFAMLTGTVSAFMVERLQGEGRRVDWETLHDHVIICGWNSKAEIIVREYRASHVRDAPIAVVAQLEHENPLPPELDPYVKYLNDDFTRVQALEKAGIHRARTCIILSDMSQGRSAQDADARTILAALTVEKLNPKVYTCAELLNASYATHLQMGHVNDYVVSGEYAGYMLAQAAMNRGLMEMINELLTYQRGNGFYRLRLPDAWVGRSFREAFEELKRVHNVILVGVQPAAGRMRVNPAEHQFQSGDEVVIISDHELRL